MWFISLQLKGSVRPTAAYYGIEEARLHIGNDCLHNNLVTTSDTLLKHEGKGMERIVET